MDNNIKNTISINNKYTLVRWDILEFEQYLHDSIAQVLPFKSYAIYFPQNNLLKKPEWLSEEEKLLLPLWYNNELLGIFMARNPEPELTKALFPVLPGIISLCLTNLELYKKGCIDLLTGLATRQNFIQSLTEETRLIQNSFIHSLYGGIEDTTPYKSSLGVIIIRFNGLAKIAREVSYTFVEQFIEALAHIFIGTIPKQTIPARTGDYEFALLVPDATNTQCKNITNKLLVAMEQYKKIAPLSDRKIGIKPYAGYTIYPQDMDGTRQVTIDTHANIVLHKAGLAAEVAHTRLSQGTKNSMAYGRLLHEGGTICQILPLSRVITSLGRRIGAREGQCFSVWSTHYETQGTKKGPLQPIYKGELVLLEVRETEAVAEILHLGDPTWPLEAGDTLLLLPEEHHLSIQELHSDKEGQPTHNIDPLTGLLKHKDFLTYFSKVKESHPHFTLTLIHADIKANNTLENQPDHIMAQIATNFNNHFTVDMDESLFGGRFALNSLIFFHSQTTTQKLHEHYTTLCTETTKQLGIRVAAGLASWPFLHFRSSDIVECCRKALEYALLLPPPHVGIFNSLAINISADKKHCRGDLFGAIEEYKLALLADKGNALAWNSLGVCMASIGHYSEAQRHFEEALKQSPDDATIYYNLGVTHQSMGNKQEALTHFQACLHLSPSHLYAMLRLGTLAEASQNIKEAISYFEQAVTIDEQQALPYRQLAKIALKEGQKEKAREYLHQALLRNPRDARTLTFMAKMYLDSNEDPELAEALSRQSIAQRPDIKSGWIELARSLEAQGRKNEAKEALLAANEL